MLQLPNNGSTLSVVPEGNKFMLAIDDGSMELEMNLTAREMQELIEYATKLLSEMIYD